MTIINKNDFIEIEFTGTANNQIFDTTNKEEAKKIGLDVDVKPVIISAGNEMLLKGFDEALIGKELNKSYKIELSPEKAFGKRQPNLLKVIPIKVFYQRQINPQQGMTVQLDNYVAKIISVSGGRVTVDFNNPLAGKDITYDFTIKRKIEDINEKINALQEFFFREKYEYKIEGKKVLLKKKHTDNKDPLADKKINFLLEIFKKKFKEILDLDFELEQEKTDKEK